MTAPACSRLQLLPIFRRVLESSWGLASPHCVMTIIMKKLQLEHCTGRFYEDEVDEVSDQKDGFESKSEFMVLNTHSLTTKNGSSRDISPPPSLGKVLFRKAQSHRNSRDILHLHRIKSRRLFNRGRCHWGWVCVSNCCSSRTAVDSSHRGFSRNQLIIFHGEVVHDYDENGAGEGLQNLKSRSAKAGGSYLRSLVILVKLMILVKLVILTNLVILTMSLLWHVGTFLAFLQPQG